MTNSNFTSETTSEYDRVKLVKASKGKRFVNYILDQVMAYIVIIGLTLAYLSIQSFIYEEGGLMDYVIAYFGFLIYYSIFEASTGRTVGKYITQTKVVTLDGNKPSFSQILGRTFARFIPFEAFSFLGDEPTGWHDSLSKTMVIDLKESVLPEEEENWADDIIDANL